MTIETNWKLLGIGLAGVMAVTSALGATGSSELLAAASTSAVSPAPLVTEESVPTATTSGKRGFTGYLELRPSWTTKSGEVHSEDEATVSYKFNADQQVQYTQYFNTNVYNPANGPSAAKGLGLYANDAFFKISLKKIWKDRSETNQLDFASKLYMPTWSARREAGFLTFSRDYFTLKHFFTSAVSLQTSVAPTFWAYTQSGSGSTPNAIYSTLAFVELDWDLTKNLSLSMPVVYEGTRYRNYANGVHLNNGWGHLVYIWPELDYTISDNALVGISYYSDNLVQDDFSRATFSKGLESGVAQLVMRATL
jgi:hypothetical protein